MPRLATGGQSGKSRLTEMIGFRLDKKDLELLDRKVVKYPGEMSRGEWCKLRILYDLRRKHIRHRPKIQENL